MNWPQVDITANRTQLIVFAVGVVVSGVYAWWRDRQ